MAKLRKAEKVYIVQSLAVFNTPTEVARDFKEIFGIELKPQNIEGYDPTKRAGKDLSEELRVEFETTRKEYLSQPLENIPAANDIVQLKILSDLLFKNKYNVVMATKLIDQIQKIMKGFYEKKIEITGKDGGPIQQETKSTHQFTPDELNGLSAQELSRLAINGKL